MTDSVNIVARLLMLAFVPAMLLIPALFVLLTRTRVEAESDRALVRSRTIVLLLATLVALAIWLGLLLASVNRQSEGLAAAARFSWAMFFPLWFVFAMQVLRIKNPAWVSVHGPGAGPMRTASLVNRSRKSPIPRWNWIFVAVICIGLLIAIASRGLAPGDAGERTRWLIQLASYAFILVLAMVTVPLGLRAVLREPEPMDAAGSPELARMYDDFRGAKIRCLFWLFAAAMPFFFGVCLTLTVWVESDQLGTLFGAIGGSAIGISGAWIGTALGLRRMRIAEFKSKLEKNGNVTA